MSDKFSISMAVGNSGLSLVAALKELSNAGGASSMVTNFQCIKSIVSIPRVFGANNLCVHFVKEIHLLPS